MLATACTAALIPPVPPFVQMPETMKYEVFQSAVVVEDMPYITYGIRYPSGKTVADISVNRAFVLSIADDLNRYIVTPEQADYIIEDRHP